jgi:cellulose synthase/poly-beta-1,6-N-acetylglucosamine synthase-like glycosyltransferase
MSQPRLSILVTAYREQGTVGRALEALISQVDTAHDELFLICPDDPTALVGSQYPQVMVLRDPGRGKPAALNLGFQHARGEIVVMTDGDVWIEQGALSALLAPFSGPSVGAVSGRPVSISLRDTMLGYWSHVLTDAGAHIERSIRDRRGEFLVCSGYLYAVRAALIEPIPEDALAEDAVISHSIAEKGFRVRYTQDSRVFVRYPSTYHDWLTQKVRSAGGYAQPVIAHSRFQMRSFRREAAAGPLRALAYARNLKEIGWTILLAAARLHLWLLILWRVRIQHQSLARLWQRVESTKS